MNFENKNVIITGASQSIGRCIAEQFAEQGAQVLITYRSQKNNALDIVKAIEATGQRAHALHADFSQMSNVADFFNQAKQTLGHIDILINNAGVLYRETLLEATPEKMQSVYQINALSPMYLSQLCAKHMIERQLRGSIINISSISGKITMKKGICYASSKAALNKWTENAAIDLAPHGIRVNAVAPGVVATGMNASTEQDNPELWQYFQERIPLGRTGTPNDISPTVLFLASEAASWITGKIIDIDGGHATQS